MPSDTVLSFYKCSNISRSGIREITSVTTSVSYVRDLNILGRRRVTLSSGGKKVTLLFYQNWWPKWWRRKKLASIIYLYSSQSFHLEIYNWEVNSLLYFLYNSSRTEFICLNWIIKTYQRVQEQGKFIDKDNLEIKRFPPIQLLKVSSNTFPETSL